MYYLYHVGDSDNLNDGYIGVTKDPARRSNKHLSGKSHINKMLTPHSKFSIISKGTVDEMIELEKLYRSSAGIGWNVRAGGGGNFSEISEETRAKLSAAGKINSAGSNNPNYGKTGKDASCYGLVKTEEMKMNMANSAKRGEEHSQFMGYYKTPFSDEWFSSAGEASKVLNFSASIIKKRCKRPNVIIMHRIKNPRLIEFIGMTNKEAGFDFKEAIK